MSCNRCGDDWYGRGMHRQPLSMEPDLCPDCQEAVGGDENTEWKEKHWSEA